MFAVGLLNSILTTVIVIALLIGLLHAGVILDVRSTYARAGICWLDAFLTNNFGAYEKILRPQNAAYFCW